VLIVASTASFQAVPYISTYAATKVFDLHLAEGLAEEMKPHGIRVCALCPGTTQSEFHEVAGHPAHSKGRQETAEKVAKTGLRALAAGKSYVISGLGNYFGAQAERLVPRRFSPASLQTCSAPKPESRSLDFLGLPGKYLRRQSERLTGRLTKFLTDKAFRSAF